MGKLSKQVFRQFVEFECDRQLFWLLGREDGRWMVDPRAPAPRDEQRSKPEVAAELGKAYEQRVYQFLGRLDGTQADTDPRGNVVESTLDAELMADLFDDLRAGALPDRICLLEHQWETPPSFLERIFGLSAGEEVPVQQWSGHMRPDIILLEQGEGEARALRPDGEVESLREGHGRIGLQLLDIKHTSEQGVGKRQFVELIFYAHGLSCWLREQGLEDRYYVAVDGHGIVPQRDMTRLLITGVDDLKKLRVPLIWEEAAHTFEVTRARLQHLRSRSPSRVAAVSVNIQPACGRCDFLEDCKRSLGMDEGKEAPPGSWDLRLIPYTSRSISEQLRERGFRTVGDVAAGLDTLELGETPEPLYPERPLLALKARALLAGEATYPDPDGAVDQRHLSIAIPQFSNLALVFDVESDPTNDVVFGVAFDLDISVVQSSPLASLHEGWWVAWRDTLGRSERVEDMDLEAIEGLLDWKALGGAADEGADDEELRRRVRQSVRDFGRSLWALDRHFGGFEITLTGEDLRGCTLSAARASFRYAYINMGLEPNHEEVLASRTVEVLYHVLQVCNGIEALIQVQGQWGPMGLSFGGFYWSAEQMQNIQDMLERHLPFLINGEVVRAQFASLVAWLTPSDSGVAHFHQHKKLFNLRTFVETCMGLPHVINYTWHEMAAADYGVTFDGRFWPKHFNYMDFSAWHDYLQELDTAAKAAQVQRIQTELLLKVGAIGRLRRDHQRRARSRDLLAKARQKPISASQMNRGMPDGRFHPLARFWALFSKLNGTIAELEAEAARTNYPAWSIGKLAAGEVTGLQGHSEDGKKGYFDFTLRGLSSNMAVHEESWVYLLPEGFRDSLVWELECAKVTIDQLTWDAAGRCYQVRARFGGSKEHPWFSLTPEQRRAEAWFLYPQASDNWSGRLFQNKDSLLGRDHLGISWLGRRLAYQWGIGDSHQIPTPTSLRFGRPEVYVFAPEMLPRGDAGPMPSVTLSPGPDASQREAIELALGSTISCIMGPPGTGKSQTIATLIEAFLRSRSGPSRVLVTTFSYAAMRVVLDKVRASRLEDGSPGAAASATLVLARSSGRDRVEPEPGLCDVRDLVLGTDGATLDDEKVKLSPRRRLDDQLGASFILFSNAYGLHRLGTRSSSPKLKYKYLQNDFGFDLIIVDEASQMPADHFLAAAALVHGGEIELAFRRAPSGEGIRSSRTLEDMSPAAAQSTEGFTKVVIVGDHNQLPPVQAVKPPRNLRPFLGSLFSYFVEGHGVPFHQLRVNYRSRPEIVAYTDRLNLYEGLTAFRGAHPYPALPAAPSASSWVGQLLDDKLAVGALIHERRFETAVSPLEAALTCDLVEGFFRQLAVSSAEEEMHFWREHVGIVAPHNAQGRLITRRIFDRLTDGPSPLTHLSAGELMASLRNTIYSVEKFQGSDRTFIIGSVGVSSRDQLGAEEEFIYDLNRFNVLTSRARQKMLLICSRNYLDFIPRDRDVMGYAARVRDFAMSWCDQSLAIEIQDSEGHTDAVELRWK